MITIKLPYKTDLESTEVIVSYMKQYNSCLHYMFNRVTENKDISEIELRKLSKDLNHIELLDSWFIQSSIKEAKSVYSKEGSKVVFGGKPLFKKRCLNLISNAEFKELKLVPLYSIGQKHDGYVKGNRKFHLNQDFSITFKPNSKIKIVLNLPSLKSNIINQLKELYLLQEQHEIPLTYKLDKSFIYISYDEIYLSKPSTKIKHWILAIDLNPNYLGLSVVDWIDKENYKIIDSKVFSIKQINNEHFAFKKQKLSSSSKERKHLNNKRTFETFEMCKAIIDIALHYQVETIALEDLKIKPKDNLKGKKYNALVSNLWLRTKFVNNLTKRANLHQIDVRMIKPEYSSFIGNLMFRNTGLPDMVLASLEISRRCNMFKLIYIEKKIEKEGVIYPSTHLYQMTVKSLESLEEFKVCSGLDGWKALYKVLKNSKIMYRVSLDGLKTIRNVLSLKTYKSKVKVYTFV